MELIQTIALLCQLSGASYATEEKQLSCQKYYVNCLNSNQSNYKDLAKCIKERKL